MYTSDGFIAKGKAKADGEAERRVSAKPKRSINDVQVTVRKAPSAHCSLCLLRGASVREECSAIFPGMKILPVGKE